jgi:SAM-dependent methyltransferase
MSVLASAPVPAPAPSSAAAPHAWSTADPWTRALRTGRGPLFLHRQDGWLLPLDVERWCAEPDAADRTVLARCHGSVLDIGCGPGRLVGSLAARGVPVLGIDVSAEAVRRTERAGGPALVRSVFEPLPGEGRWDTVLLMDGNIGIGGDPAGLLGRVAEIAGPRGALIVEAAAVRGAEAHAELDELVDVRLHDGVDAHGAPFPWARVGVAALLRHARGAGWAPGATWTACGRHFAVLRRRG